jgi:uncharacterized protein (DUF1015 family)
MADVRPFRALRPRDDIAASVIAPPYDVLTDAEARALAAHADCFVHVTRSEVDLPAGADAHSQAAYDQARANLDALQERGAMVLDREPTYYLYGQKMGDHSQVGVVAACSVDEYDCGDIRKHEYTRPDKEDDRTHHMEVLDAQVGLVFLAARPDPTLSEILQQLSSAAPAWRVTTEDDVEHALWPIPQEHVASLRGVLEAIPRLYIADGHHRSAAASRVHANRGAERTAHFLAGIFPADQLQVMAYNRVVNDLNGHTPDAFLEAVRACFDISPGTPVPTARQTFSMYLGGAWFTLTPKSGSFNEADPVARLDVAILQDNLLGPILGIEDPRRSERIRFVGGIRGPQALVEAVDTGAAVAFHMYPTGMDQLFDVADADQVMPPKSTWFEPKLREGVVVRLLDRG